MKELLYIPNGSFCKFRIHANKTISYEEFANSSDYPFSLEVLIENIYNGCWDAFIERNNLPNDGLTIEQFELVDT